MHVELEDFEMQEAQGSDNNIAELEAFAWQGVDLKDVEQEVVSYRESVAEVPNQIGFAKLPNKVKVGKALAQQADGLKKLSEYEAAAAEASGLKPLWEEQDADR